MPFDPFQSGLATPVEQKPTTPPASGFDPFATGQAVEQPANKAPANPADRVDWVSKFSGTGVQPGDPSLNKEAIVNSYIQTQLKGVPTDFVDKNAELARNTYAKNYLHLPGDNFSVDQLYDSIGKNIGVNEVTKRNNNLPAWYVGFTHNNNGAPLYGSYHKDMPPIKIDEFMPLFWQSIKKPMLVLPDAKNVPDLPELGIQNPAVWAGVYNGVKSVMEDFTSVTAIGTLGAGGELALASKTSAVAGTVLKSMQGVFAAAAFITAANENEERKKIFANPNSTTADKVAITTKQTASVLTGVLLSLDSLPQAKPGQLETLPLSPELPSGARPTPPKPTGPFPYGEELQLLPQAPLLTVDQLRGLSVKDSIAALDWAANNAPSAADMIAYQNAHQALLPLAVDLPGDPEPNKEPTKLEPAKAEEDKNLGEVKQEAGDLIAAPKDEIEVSRNQIREIQDALEASVNPKPMELIRTASDEPTALTDDDKAEVDTLNKLNEQEKLSVTDPMETQAQIQELVDDTAEKTQNVFEALNEALYLAGSFEDDTLSRTRSKYTPLEKAKLQTKETKLKLKETVAKLRSVLGDKIANIELNMDWQLAKQKYFLKKAAQEKIAELENEHVNKINELKAKYQDQLTNLRYNKNAKLDELRAQKDARFAEYQSRTKENLKNLTAIDKQGNINYDVLRRNLMDVANRLPAKSRGKFVEAITDALKRPSLGKSSEGMYAKTYDVTWRMLLELDKVQKQNLVDQINNTIKKSLDSPSVDVMAKRKIRESLNRVISNNPQATIDSFGGQPLAETNAVDLANFNVEMISQTKAKDLPISVLQSLSDRIEMLQKAGRRLVKMRKFQFQALQDELKSKILSGPSDPINKVKEKMVYGIEASDEEKLKIKTQNAIARSIAMAKDFNRQFLTTDIIGNMLEGLPKDNYGQLSRYLKGTLDLAYNSELNLYNQFSSPIKQVLQKYPSFTEDEAYRIGIYGILQQEGGLQRLIDSGLTAKQATDISLTNKEAEMYIAIRNAFDSALPVIQKTHYVLNNQELTAVKNYWPLIRDFAKTPVSPTKNLAKAKEGAEIEYADLIKNNDSMVQLIEDVTGFRRTKTEKGFTVERIQDATGAVKLNGIEVALSHLKQAAHFVAQQPDLTMLANIVASKEFAAKYGDLGQKYYLDLLDSVARDADPSLSTRSRFIDHLVRNINQGEISFRFIGQLKHLPNVVFTAKNVNPDIMFYAVERLNDPKVNDFLIKNFAEVATRRTAEVSVEEIMQKDFLKKASTNAFYVESKIDQLHGNVAAIGSVMQQYRDMGLDWKNFTDLPLPEDVQKKALRIARESVNSILRKDLPFAISRGTITGGHMSYARAFTAFQGIMYKNYSMMQRDLLLKGVSKKDMGQVMGQVLLYSLYVIGVSAVGYISKEVYHTLFGSKEPEGLVSEVTNEALRLMPASNVLLAAKHNETGIPALDLPIRTYKNINDLISQTNASGKPLSPKQKDRLVLQGITNLGVVGGVPASGEIGRALTPETGKKPGTRSVNPRDINQRFRYINPNASDLP